MSRFASLPLLTAALLALATLVATVAARAETPPVPAVADVVAHYTAARGGADAWAARSTLEAEGIYATFSEKHPFTLVRARPNLYRFDFTMLGAASVRAHDASGPWWLYPLLGVGEPSRLDEGPYRALVQRDARFVPPLIGAPDNGVAVVVEGYTDLDGIEVLKLGVTLPGAIEETWYLDVVTHLEVAIDDQVFDHSQGPNAMDRRTFFSDFRTVGGLVLPHRVEHEFGARLEVMEIESVTFPDTIDAARFAGPAPATDTAEASASDGR